MQNITIGIIVTLVVLALGGFLFFSGGDESVRSGSGDGENGQSAPSGTFDKAPDFTLKDYEGNYVSLSDFAGKVRVVNSWAAWCPFCVDEMPDFAALQEEFPDDIVVIAIDRAEPLSTAKKFTDEVGVTGRMVLLLDPNDSFYKSIGGFSMPETLFVDGDGNIRTHKRGPMSLQEMKDKVRPLFENNVE